MSDTPNKSNGFEFLLKEYEELWRYYQTTLEERARTFSYYFQLVGIPGAIVLAFSTRFEEPNTTEYSLSIALGEPLLGLLFLVVAIIGCTSYCAYTLESENSRQYVRSMRDIREYIRQTHPELSDALTIDKRRGGDNPTWVQRTPGVTFYRGMVLVILNSAIATCGLAILVSTQNLALITFLFITTILFQFGLAWLISRKYK